VLIFPPYLFFFNSLDYFFNTDFSFTRKDSLVNKKLFKQKSSRTVCENYLIPLQYEDNTKPARLVVEMKRVSLDKRRDLLYLAIGSV